jgi:hypothetical protein
MKKLIFLVLLISGCAMNSTIPVNYTPVIPSSLEQVKTRIVNSLTSKGYNLRKSDPMVFEKEIGNVIISALYKTKFDPTPIFRVTITLLPIESTTKVILNSEIVSNDGTAFEHSTKTKANKDVDRLLTELKE